MLGSSSRSASWLTALILSMAACGGSSSSGPAPGNTDTPSGTGDAGQTTPPAAPLDHGQVSTTYPAFAPDMPEVQNNGGSVLASPVLVTVTWPGDPSADTFDAFADAIGSSKYWSEVVSEYGVGPATSGAANHVRMKDSLGPKIMAADIEKIITTNLQASPSTWPAPTDNTIYTLFLPASTQVFEQAGDTQDDCSQGAGGYHASVTWNGKSIVYAVILQCPGFTAKDATLSASHEWDEASVDPYVMDGKPGFVGLDARHFAYDLLVQNQDETGDMCEFDPDQQIDSQPDLPFSVQRQWSNKSAKAGHAPCVPAPATPFHNLVALTAPKDTVTYDLSVLDPSYGAMKGLGYALAVGADMVIPIGIYSDGPTEAVSVSVSELDLDAMGDAAPVLGGKNVKLTLDRAFGKNGEKLYLTIKRTAKSSTDSHLILIDATIGKATSTLPIIVGDADALSKVMTDNASTMRRPGVGTVLHGLRGTRSRLPGALLAGASARPQLQ
jgi:hypothetical protein